MKKKIKRPRPIVQFRLEKVVYDHFSKMATRNGRTVSEEAVFRILDYQRIVNNEGKQFARMEHIARRAAQLALTSFARHIGKNISSDAIFEDQGKYEQWLEK